MRQCKKLLLHVQLLECGCGKQIYGCISLGGRGVWGTCQVSCNEIGIGNRRTEKNRRLFFSQIALFEVGQGFPDRSATLHSYYNMPLSSSTSLYVGAVYLMHGLRNAREFFFFDLSWLPRSCHLVLFAAATTACAVSFPYVWWEARSNRYFCYQL